MRLRIVLDNPRETRIPLNYQEYLTGAIYHLIETSDVDYSQFLHDEGYAVDDGPKRFKLFVFGWLRTRRPPHPAGDSLILEPGPIEWQIASPVEASLRHFATGLLSAGEIRVQGERFLITDVEAIPKPDLSSGVLHGICLSPIVASVHRSPEEGGKARYLRPADGVELSEALRRNLNLKRQTLTGMPSDEPLEVQFNKGYCETHRGGTKLMAYKGIQIPGSFAPFIARGSRALLEIGYECGFGEKNTGGFGMVEGSKQEPLRRNKDRSGR